jgi:hypothetical protein
MPPAKKPAKKPAKAPTRKAAKKPAKAPTRKAAKKPARAPAKKPARKPAKGRLREKNNVVSVWLGTMTSRKAFDAYITEDDVQGRTAFARDLRVSTDSVEFIESSFSEAGAPADALAGHTFADEYSAKVTAAAKKLGLTRVNSAAVILDYVYTPPPDATFADGKLTFIGVFPYDTDA